MIKCNCRFGLEGDFLGDTGFAPTCIHLLHARQHTMPKNLDQIATVRFMMQPSSESRQIDILIVLIILICFWPATYHALHC